MCLITASSTMNIWLAYPSRVSEDLEFFAVLHLVNVLCHHERNIDQRNSQYMYAGNRHSQL